MSGSCCNCVKHARNSCLNMLNHISMGSWDSNSHFVLVFRSFFFSESEPRNVTVKEVTFDG